MTIDHMPHYIEMCNGRAIYAIRESYGWDFMIYGATIGGDPRITPSLGMAREIAELSLAHEVGSAVERAYRRSDLLTNRRTLMERWARFCCPVSADVIEIGGSGHE